MKFFKENLEKTKSSGLFRLDILAFAILFFALVSELSSMNTTLYADEILLDRLINCTNQIRREAQLEPLYLNYELNQAAYNKLRDMDNFNYWSHYNPVTGADPWEFIDGVDYVYENAGENLAIGYFDSINVCDAWRTSPTHLSNLINSNYQEIGFAIDNVDLGDDGMGVLVVQMFGSRNDFEAPTDERAYYNLICDDEINDDTFIISPSCEVIKEIEPEIAFSNPERLNLNFAIDKEPFEIKLEADGDHFTTRYPEPLTDGRHELTAENESVASQAAQVEFLIDTEVPQLNPNDINIQYLKVTEDQAEYRVTVKLEKFSYKFFEKVALKLSSIGETKEIIINEKLLQRISPSEYVADFSVPRNKINENPLSAEITLVDAVGNQVSLSEEMPTPHLNSQILMQTFASIPLSIIFFVRRTVSILAFLIPIPAFIYMHRNRKAYEKAYRYPYYNFLLLIMFLGLVTLVL